jgi:triosephosphate isomerase
MKYVIANWKMQLLNNEAVKLARDLKQNIVEDENKKVVICPSFIALNQVWQEIAETDVALGSQNVWYENKGAFTGEVSLDQLQEMGVEYVIIGHSERREYNSETDIQVNAKVKKAVEKGIIPIICVGETKKERENGEAEKQVQNQVAQALQNIGMQENTKIIIAYEPVWVIGTGQAVEPEEAKKMAELIKNTLNEEVMDKFTIVYGGSVDAQNVASFMEEGLIDGVLVGGASLSLDKFLPLIENV